MIECELKKGNSSGLFLINRVISKLNFIQECKFSKKEIAMMQSKHEMPLQDVQEYRRQTVPNYSYDSDSDIKLQKDYFEQMTKISLGIPIPKDNPFFIEHKDITRNRKKK